MRADLAPHAYIVGPNSAGKSTVLEAIGLAEQCLRVARRKSPTAEVFHDGRRRRGFLLSSDLDSEEDPVRHDFGREETRVTVQWATGSRIQIVWPEESDDRRHAFFYLEEEGGSQPSNLSGTRQLFSPITIVPVVTPLDRIEELKNPVYVESHRSTRLASRHFRNNARLMGQAGQWDAFRDFCLIWLPEIQLLDVSLSAAANRLSVFYSEVGSRVPKELAWAGDGIQIWVQLLWHLFNARDSTTIVLDEPEVYLHPDLQRRLVRLLDGLAAQIILASHSAEVIAEAPPDGVLWVDRRLGGARRLRSQQTLSNLSISLGSSYNLALARSMRARLVVASDCEDLRIIRAIAKHLGASNIANEQAVSLVPLRDVRSWSRLDQLGASLREVLPAKTPAVVLLQGGHRPPHLNRQISDHLGAPGITVTVLSRSELESYLLDADTIARVSGAAPETVDQRISEICLGLRESSRASFTAAWVGAALEGRGEEALHEAALTFDAHWADPARRVELVRGTEVINALNTWLERDGYRTISGLALARAVRPQVLPPDLLHALLAIDEVLQ